MNKEMEKLIQQMLYNMTKEEVLDTLSNIESPEVLYGYAYNYNWDNGFEIPEKIINKNYSGIPQQPSHNSYFYQ